MPYERKTYDLHISDELRQILTEFQSESIVASLLLKKRHEKEELVDSPVNFISISREDRTKISYLSEDRMAQMDVSDYWTSSRRFQAKPGAFISKIFKNIPGKEVEKFSNLFRSQANKPKFKFDVVKGEAIKGFYYYESYASDKGTLGASCMKHDSCQKYLDIYSDNSNRISLLVMTNDFGELLGRALLWQFDSYKLMDRIYTICDEDLSFYFKQWATQNGYLYKSEQNWYNTMQFEQLGQKRQELKLEVSLDRMSYRYFPYMDTFKFLDRESGKLTNYMPKNENFRILCSSEGSTYDYDYLIFDDIDRVLRYRGDVSFLNYLRIWTHNKNVHYSEVNDQNILIKDSKYDESIDDYVFAGEWEHLNDQDSINKRKASFEEIKTEPKRVFNLSAFDLESVISQLGIVDAPTLESLRRLANEQQNEPESTNP